MINRKILWLVVFLIVSSMGLAIGVSPMRKVVDFEPNAEYELQLKIWNEGHKDIKAVVYARGELAEYIGIVDSLVSKGHEVIVYDNLSSGAPENLKEVSKDIEFVKGDINDFKSLNKVVKEVDIVSHQAAQLEIGKCLDDPVYDLMTNTGGTLNVLKSAVENNVSKIINASSACVYGQAVQRPQPESHPKNPNWAYGVSKLAAEKYCDIFSNNHDIPIISLRYGIVYGEREWFGRVLPIFIKRFIQGKPLIVFGKGEQIRDFVYVKDVAI